MNQRERDALDRHITGDFRFFPRKDDFHYLYSDEQEDDMTDLAPLPTPRLIAPDGRRFPWGPIQHIHRIGRYEVVEYLRDASNMHSDDPDRTKHGTLHFHPFVDGIDTSRSYRTIEEAVVGAIAYAYDGVNSQAATYFSRMIALNETVTG